MVIDTPIAPVEPLSVGTTVYLSADFSDSDPAQIHTAVIEWGDGSNSAGTVNETNGSGTISGNHTYATPGVYILNLTVANQNDNFAKAVFRYVVIYDPNAGFVTGGGWIDSPAGAYPADPSLTGKANFGLVSRYQKGANTPDGNTSFNFKVADLSFHSDTYKWLVVAGPKAQFKGNGTINGTGNYGFMLAATDEALTPSTNVDLFRIKIWDKDDGDRVVYDNNIGAADDADPATALGGGSIVIHK